MRRGVVTTKPGNRRRAVGIGAAAVLCAALLGSCAVLPALADPRQDSLLRWGASFDTSPPGGVFGGVHARAVDDFGLVTGGALTTSSLSVDARMARAHARIFGMVAPGPDTHALVTRLLRVDAPFVLGSAGSDRAGWRASSATLRQRAEGEILLMASDRAPGAARVDIGATPAGISPEAWVGLSVLDPEGGGVVVASRTASPGGGMTLVRARSETDSGAGALGVLLTDGRDLTASAFAVVWDSEGTAVIASGDPAAAQVTTLRHDRIAATSQQLSVSAAPFVSGADGREITPGAAVLVGRTREIARERTTLAAVRGPGGEAGVPEISIMTTEEMRTSSRAISINATMEQPLGAADTLIVGAVGGVTIYKAHLARGQHALMDGTTLADFGERTAARRGLGLSGMLSVGVMHRLSQESTLTLGIGGGFATGIPTRALGRVSAPGTSPAAEGHNGHFQGTGEEYARPTITTTNSGAGVVFLRYELLF
jgi:hypothetical protein